MAVTEEQVREQLKQVFDPELPGVNIVDLGLIYVVEIEEIERAGEAGESETRENEAVAAENKTAGNEAGERDETGSSVKVRIEMTMTSPMCPAGPQLVGNSKQVVLQLEGVAEVEVKVVMDPPWSPDKMTDDARDILGIF